MGDKRRDKKSAKQDEAELPHICKYCAAYMPEAELCRSRNGCYNPRPFDFCSYYSKNEVLDRYET